MTDKDIREAIDLTKDFRQLMLETDWGGIPKTQGAFREAFQKLIDLAQSYLSIEGFPEEKIIQNNSSYKCNDCGEEIINEYWKRVHIAATGHKVTSINTIFIDNISYNQALKDCKLALLKKFSAERIKKVVFGLIDNKSKTYDITDNYGEASEAFVEDLFQAIHKLLEVE